MVGVISSASQKSGNQKKHFCLREVLWFPKKNIARMNERPPDGLPFERNLPVSDWKQ
jgi:hypothetical protein